MLALPALLASVLSCGAPQESKQGCTADIECKGNRVCIDAKCVEMVKTQPPQSNTYSPDETEKEAMCPELNGDFFVGDWGELYRVTVKDGAPTFAQNITNTPNASETYFCVSPNKEWVAFVMDENIQKIRSDGSERTQLTTYSGQYSWVAWSKKEDKIFFTRDVKRIYSMRSDGTNEEEFFSEFWHIQSFSFSPDAKKIAVGGRPTDDNPGKRGGVYIIDSDEKDVTEFIDDPCCAEGWPTWSPDGKFILYVSSNDCDSLYVSDLTGNKKLLAGYPQYILGSHAWSPDSSKIAYWEITNYDAGEDSAMWIIDTEGKNKKKCLMVEDTNYLIGGFDLISWFN